MHVGSVFVRMNPPSASSAKFQPHALRAKGCTRWCRFHDNNWSMYMPKGSPSCGAIVVPSLGKAATSALVSAVAPEGPGAASPSTRAGCWSSVPVPTFVVLRGGAWCHLLLETLSPTFARCYDFTPSCSGVTGPESRENVAKGCFGVGVLVWLRF